MPIISPSIPWAREHGGVIITEQPAVLLYLADLYPKAGLAPATDNPLRGAYLRWMVYCGSCFVPAILDRVHGREMLPRGRSQYGSWDDMYTTLASYLDERTSFLGDTFSAADVLWALAFQWSKQFANVTWTPAIEAYVERTMARPAMQRAMRKNSELAASQSTEGAKS